jgi:hypothetical protein
MGRYVFVVAHDQPALYSHLANEFSGELGVEVILDRRRGERRRYAVAALSPAERRRQQDRRSERGIDRDLRANHFALVRVE